MAVGTAYDCAALPSWASAQCCQGCHGALNDVRPIQVRFSAGYPIGAAAPLVPAGSTRVLCCRAQLHATMAMGGVAEFSLDTLGLPT